MVQSGRLRAKALALLSVHDRPRTGTEGGNCSVRILADGGSSDASRMHAREILWEVFHGGCPLFMKTDHIIAIQTALDEADVRFILVGGLAVVAHGYLRFTRDADLVIELVPDNIKRAFRALEQIGYRPTVPITAEAFSDEERRREWREQKNMRVLQFWSDAHPETKLDVFVEHPFDFEAEWAAAKLDAVRPDSSPLRIASIPTLIRMKREAGRPRDLDDIHHLELLLQQQP